MIKLKIDNTVVEVQEGTSVKDAAESIGISIPAMCFMKGFSNSPSCSVCLVKDKNKGNLFSSCTMEALEGMEILSEIDEVKEARKDALELLLSDHVGDCEAPCRNGCPAFMDIPQMNRLIASGNFKEALIKVKEEIALPLILGYICSAPCEKVCRRVPIDEAVSICQLEKSVAAFDLNSENPYLPLKAISTGKRVAIIGAGPAGLAAAFHLTIEGHDCVIFDKNTEAGGSLRNIPESGLPKQALNKEINYLRSFGVEFKLNQNISPDYFDKIKKEFDAVILAIGDKKDIAGNDQEINLEFDNLNIDKDTYSTNLSGIFACGSFVRKQSMAVKAVAQGKLTARSVNKFLLGEKLEKTQRMFNSKFGKLKPEEFGEYLKESTKDTRFNPNNNLNGFSSEEAINEAKRCMHCDCRKIDNCKLRIFSDEYQVDRRAYLSGERKSIKKYNTHESIVYEPEKCIKCGLCVEITVNEKELTGLAFVGRGFDVRIDIPFTRTMDDALIKTAAKCAEACPTAAISFRK